MNMSNLDKLMNRFMERAEKASFSNIFFANIYMNMAHRIKSGDIPLENKTRALELLLESYEAAMPGNKFKHYLTQDTEGKWTKPTESPFSPEVYYGHDRPNMREDKKEGK